MRVCLVTSAPIPPAEGIGYHVWNLAKEIQRRNHRATIVTRGGRGLHSIESRDGIEIYRAPYAPIYPFHVHLHGLFVNRLIRRLEGEFDIVNAHMPLAPPIRSRTPVVTTVHSLMRADSAQTHGRDLRSWAIRLQTPISHGLEQSQFRRSAAITTVARWVADEIAKDTSDQKTTVVTGNGVEERFLTMGNARTANPCVLYVGRLERGKGLLDLVEAARQLCATGHYPNLQYLLVGEGPLRSELEARIASADLGRCVRLLGQLSADRRDDLLRLYENAWLFVLPSHHEGMPTVLLEAMACGLPVIATSVGGCRELIAHGDNGLLVPARSPQSLAKAIAALLADRATCAHLGRCARATIERSFTWRQVGDRYLACFDEVLNPDWVTHENRSRVRRVPA